MSDLTSRATSAGRAALEGLRRRVGRDTGGSGPDGLRVLTIQAEPDDLRRQLSDPLVLGRVVAAPYTGHPRPWEVEVEPPPSAGEVGFRARSSEGAEALGVFSFESAPNGLGTELRLALRLDGPDPAAGAMAHKVLRRTKALVETGEIPTLDHNPSARHDPDDTPDPDETRPAADDVTQED